MSSATSSSASPSSSSPAASSSSTGTPIDLSGNSSLPFSFLITFVAIFLFFLGCGLGSRRVTRQLRRNLGLQITPASGTSSLDQPLEKPILWDVYPSDSLLPLKHEAGGSRAAYGYAWENLSPLNATYVRTPLFSGGSEATGHPPHEPPPPPRWIPGRGMMRSFASTPSLARPLPPQINSYTPSRRATRIQPEVRWRGHRLPPFLARPLLPPGMERREIRSGPIEDTSETAPVRALQIAVLIAMPSPAAPRAGGARSGSMASAQTGKEGVGAEIEVLEVNPEEDMGDFMLGSTCVAWSEEVDGVEGADAKGAML
ncbi:hypothetical protein BV20DRAFT_970585 [Pilatotrama ljubarskyi]|nr:hypothetical protein BV20DRAFT_970585 [Pilatotrama ljubarskyi]